MHVGVRDGMGRRGTPGWVGQMSIYRGYVYWRGHDAGGTLPPVDVLAGLLAGDAARAGAGVGAVAAPGGCRARDARADADAAEGLLVHVPPQWLGDWETGHPLAPGYQYLWRVPRDRLSPLDSAPRSTPYRPPALPPAATGARPSSRRRPARRDRQE